MLEIADLKLREFFDNSLVMKHKVEQDGTLLDVIRSCLTSGRFPDHDTYQPLIEKRLGFKARKMYGRNELCVTADLYQEGLPTSSFAILINEDSLESAFYLVEDFGIIDDIHCPPWGQPKVPQHLRPDYEKFLQVMRQKGYIPQIGHGEQRSFGIADSGKRLVVHDLDCGLGTMNNSEEIYNGAMHGEGNFKRLLKIWEIFKSSDFSLRLES